MTKSPLVHWMRVAVGSGTLGRSSARYSSACPVSPA
jgi:hypothetical protein